MKGSTPTIAGLSRIIREFEKSDKRRFFVPCPHCGEFQTLEWGGRDVPHGIKWQTDPAGDVVPESVVYVCKAHGCIIEEVDKPAMVGAGEWRATVPFRGHAGFHIWAGYSLFFNASWANLAAEWLRVKGDPKERQTFVNLVLGEAYEELSDRSLNERTLAARAEVWDADVPDGVAVITVGVDVQDDRVEVEIVGWGRDEESWSIAHEVIEGDPDTAEVWAKVDALLLRKWHRADGRAFACMAACVDSGGHHTQRVYEFCKARLGRRIWAVKGEAARGGTRSPVWPTKRPSARNKAAFRPVIIGVNAAKDTIRNRLHRDTPGQGYMHFPAKDRDLGYFAQLVAERTVTKQKNGQRFRVWEVLPGRANEALDLRVYAYAALCGLLHFGLKLNRRVDEVSREMPEGEPQPVAPDEGASAPEDPGPVRLPPLETPKPAVIVHEKPGQKRSRVAGFA